MLKLPIFIILIVAANQIKTENIFLINGKKYIHEVSDKFLSISIDPIVLISGLRISETSLFLASHLSPCYIRFAGPSTQFIRFSETNNPRDSSDLIVTPIMWESVNEWMTLANLTPIFGLNDVERTTEGLWNPKEMLPLLKRSKKIGLEGCLWQLGYDCSGRTPEVYVDDLRTLRRVVYEELGVDTWKIVGSDFSKCLPGNQTALVRKIPENLAEAFMWESLETPNLKLPYGSELWTSVPKAIGAICFEDALFWMKNAGDAAKFGYSVLFRTPRLHELQNETPVFWVSLMHKFFVGKRVLEVRTLKNTDNTEVYAHCTQNQNKYPKRGAVTVFAVNFGENTTSLAVKIGSALFKNVPVHSYVVTASENKNSALLNGEELFLGKLANGAFTPKIHVIQTDRSINLQLPPKSIAFFVLPNARLSACLNQDDTENILKEMTENQKTTTAPTTLKLLKQNAERELKFDENYYEAMEFNGDKPKSEHRRDVSSPKITSKSQRKRFVISRKTRRLIDALKDRIKRDINMDLLNLKVGRRSKHREDDFFELDDSHRLKSPHVIRSRLGQREQMGKRGRDDGYGLINAKKFLSDRETRRNTNRKVDRKEKEELSDSFEDYYYDDYDDYSFDYYDTRNKRSIENSNYVTSKPYKPYNNKKKKQFNILKIKLKQHNTTEDKKQRKPTDLKRKLRSAEYFPIEYIQKTKNYKTWKPEDILKFNKRESNRFTFSELTALNETNTNEDYKKTINIQKIPRNHKHKLERTKRDTSSEDIRLNEISKDSFWIQPRLDVNSGEYGLTLPNGDKVELTADKEEEIIETVATTTDGASAETEESSEESKHVQKIPKRSEVDWFEKLYESFTLVMEKIHKQLLKLLK